MFIPSDLTTHSVEIQNCVINAPIKEIVVENETGDLYRAFMVLDNGLKISCNFGSIGSGCFGARGDKEKVKEGWRKELEKFWFSRNLGVLIEE